MNGLSKLIVIDKGDPRKYYNLDLDKICVVCLKEMKINDASYRSNCGHPFHYKCFKDYYEISYKCPVCDELIDGSIPFHLLSDEEKSKLAKVFDSWGRKNTEGTQSQKY